MRASMDTLIEVPMPMLKAFGSLKAKTSVINEFNACLDDLESIKNQLDPLEQALYSYIYNYVGGDTSKPFKIVASNRVQSFDTSKAIALCNAAITGCNAAIPGCDARPLQAAQAIFEMCLFRYQLDNEARYLKDYDFSAHITSLMPYVERLRHVAAAHLHGTSPCFQVSASHPNLPIRGRCDMFIPGDKQQPGRIIETKMSQMQTCSSKTAMQLLLYYNNMFPSWSEKTTLEMWNLYDCTRHVVTCNVPANIDLLKLLCRKLQVKMKDNVFVYDLETTDLTESIIIERHMVELYLGYVASTGLVRPPVHHVLSPFVTQLTGITPAMLAHETTDPDLRRFKRDVDSILNFCDQPTFIAHNGAAFDHKIMTRRGLFPSTSRIRLLDSRTIIRMFSSVDTLGNTLGTLKAVYEELCPEADSVGAHRAAADVTMVVCIFREIGLSLRQVHGC